MDIVTYAAANGISIEDAKAVLEEMGNSSTPEAQKNTQEVFQVNPRQYMPRDPGRGNHYAGRGAARRWISLPHLP